MNRTGLLLALAALALACSPPDRRGRDDGDDGSDAGSTTTCTAGATIDCTCQDGSVGEATCTSDGSRYGVCACGGSQFCTPGAANTCTCATGSGMTTCLPDGSGWATCQCQPTTCQPTALSPVGDVLYPGGSILFTGGTVQASFGHRRGLDDTSGCIAKANLVVAKGGCALSLAYGGVTGAHGGLKSATFESDGSCGPAGSWESASGYGPTWFTGASSIPDPTSASSCASASVSFTDDVLPLFDLDGQELDLTLGGLVLAGNLTSTGDTSLVCVETSCAGAYHEANGWCVTGACGPGQHDGGSGACVPTGSCSPGYGLTDQGDCAQAPTCAASVSAPASALVGATVSLDGSGSAAGPSPTYRWTLAGPPLSRATLSSPTSAVTSFVPDLAGQYVATLTVSSSTGCTNSREATINATATTTTGHALSIQLSWMPVGSTTPGGDLDLHVRGPASASHPSIWFEQQADCDYANCPPGGIFVGGLDWGSGDTVDPDGLEPNNPVLEQDVMWGEAPETTSFQSAFDGTFAAAAMFYCDHNESSTGPVGATVSQVTATLTVVLDGAVVGTPVTSPSLVKGQLWEGALITVSGGGSHVTVAPSSAQLVQETDPSAFCP